MKFGENYELGIRICQIKDLNIKILHESFLIYNIKSALRVSNSIPNKLASNRYLLNKHKKLFDNDPLSHSRLAYQIGYLNQQSGNFKLAIEFYKEAWKIKPNYLKPLIRFFHLKGLDLLKYFKKHSKNSI